MRIAGLASPERADTDGPNPSGAGWRSPGKVSNLPVCGTSEWCCTGADPLGEGPHGCLNLRSRRKTVTKSGFAPGGAGDKFAKPLTGAAIC
jgi:hypothetical protein